jgi:hypothetical protein
VQEHSELTRLRHEATHHSREADLLYQQAGVEQAEAERLWDRYYELAERLGVGDGA